MTCFSSVEREQNALARFCRFLHIALGHHRLMKPNYHDWYLAETCSQQCRLSWLDGVMVTSAGSAPVVLQATAMLDHNTARPSYPRHLPELASGGGVSDGAMLMGRRSGHYHE
jgi:hypothetical protein